MNIPTENAACGAALSLQPTVLNAGGKPAFAVLPWAQYLRLLGEVGEKSPPVMENPRIPADGSIPHEVIVLMTERNLSLIRAWREYLGVTQSEMAARLGIRQPSYAAMEASGGKPKKSTRERIAAALGLLPEQVEL